MHPESRRTAVLFRIALCAVLLPLLAACASIDRRDRPLPTQELNPPRGTITGFLLEGRFSARQADKGYNGNVIWEHQPETDRIILSGPLGQGSSELRRTPEGVRLVDPQGRVKTASTWDALAEEMFGFPLPLSKASRWMLADVQAQSYDPLGRATSALQDGWSLRYPEFASSDPNALPTVLIFQRGDTEVRFKILKWLAE